MRDGRGRARYHTPAPTSASPFVPRLTLGRRVAGAFAVGGLYLVIVMTIAYSSMQRVRETHERSDRTTRELLALAEIFSIVTDAETGARGYVLTGDERYLASARIAERAVARRLATLRELAAIEPSDAEATADLSRLVEARLASIRETIEVRERHGIDSAAALVRTGRGRVLTDSIRIAIDRRTASGTARLAGETEEERERLQTAILRISLASVIASMIVVAAFLTVRRDLAVRRQAEDEARRAREQAERANRAKSDFLARMSHELRTPLNSVIGFSKVLLRQQEGDGAESGASARDRLYLEQILAGGTHLLALVDDVLDLAKLDAGRMTVVREPVDVAVLVDELVASFAGQLHDRPVELRAELPPGMAPLTSDRQKLRQVLANLVANALKFTERGEVVVRVHAPEVGAAPERIDVVDTGIGIPSDRLGAIFESFEQADEGTSRRFGGTGLGLAIARSFCELLGYRLEVESREGEGSRFSVVMGSPAER